MEPGASPYKQSSDDVPKRMIIRFKRITKERVVAFSSPPGNM